jgi:hypothetical protein
MMRGAGCDIYPGTGFQINLKSDRFIRTWRRRRIAQQFFDFRQVENFLRENYLILKSLERFSDSSESGGDPRCDSSTYGTR